MLPANRGERYMNAGVRYMTAGVRSRDKDFASQKMSPLISFLASCDVMPVVDPSESANGKFWRCESHPEAAKVPNQAVA